MSTRLSDGSTQSTGSNDEPNRADSFLDALAKVSDHDRADSSPRGRATPLCEPSLTTAPVAAPPRASAAVSSVAAPAPFFVATADAGPRRSRSAETDWKLSARLDHDLLAELYGAAESLAGSGATVSKLVEEAIRLYLPRLRDRHNDGRPFPKGGRRPRSRGQSDLLGAAPSAPSAPPPDAGERLLGAGTARSHEGSQV